MRASTTPSPPSTKSTVIYAITDDGRRLPLIDVTNPAFAVTATDEELSALSAQFLNESKQRERIPAFLRRLFLRLALRRSVIGRGLMASSGTFLNGMNTYLLKLGPENLGSDAGAMDRRIAASFPALSARQRLQDMAELLADGLTAALAAGRNRPLCLLNIAGGPAADTWNALILIAREHREWLTGRAISVAVLDLDEQGPSFGARGIEALVAPGAPLDGLHIDFRSVRYDWRHVVDLGSAVDRLCAREAVSAISSEGGLFEYGEDEEIIANLQALQAVAPPDAIVVGSVTRDALPARVAQAASRVRTRPRTLAAFRSLCEGTGWVLDRVIERPFSFNVRMVKAHPSLALK